MHETRGIYGRRGTGKKLINTDDELQLIHYYVQRGFDWDRLAALSSSEKMFLMASMELAMEEEAEKFKVILGGGTK